MIEKLKTAVWFAQRPAFWAHALELAGRKFRKNLDTPADADAARRWAASEAVSVAEAISKVGLPASAAPSALPGALMSEARAMAEKSKVRMGGPGDVDLLYAAATASEATRIVETGVAYGWSSLAILAAIRDRANARLVSVDMPYPKLNNEQFVGIVVPQSLRPKWELVREPDRNGLVRAISILGGEIDLCHYDSDKSYWGRKFGFDLMWKALRPGGIFISDDIQDNLAFKEFVAEKNAPFAVTAYQQKYIGITRKHG